MFKSSAQAELETLMVLRISRPATTAFVLQGDISTALIAIPVLCDVVLEETELSRTLALSPLMGDPCFQGIFDCQDLGAIRSRSKNETIPDL